MLVGAGEIDAALLVVAADDGPNAQTLEHLGLLDALGIDDGLAVVTKADLVDGTRVGEVVAEVEALLASTSLAGIPVLAASATTGDGIDDGAGGDRGAGGAGRRRGWPMVAGRGSRSTASSRSRVAGRWSRAASAAAA